MKTENERLVFAIEYQLQEDPQPRKWRGRAQSTGEFPAQAIINFATDYSSSMGTVIAVRIIEHGNSAKNRT